MAYGDRYYVYDSSATTLAGQDPFNTGFVHRATIRQSGYAGGTTVLGGHLSGSGPIVIEHGRPGPADVFEPLPGSTCTIRFAAQDDALATLAEALVGQGDAAFEVVVERAVSGVAYADDAAFTAAASLVWRGVTLQESTEHLAYAASYGAIDFFTLKAVDGFGLLSYLGYPGRNTSVDGTGISTYGSFLGAFFRALSSLTDDGLASTGLSGFSRLYTLDTWYPWLPTHLTASDDPVERTFFYQGAFFDEDRGVETAAGDKTRPLLEVLQELLARKAQRLIQSDGDFYALQRTALEADAGNPTLFAYDDTGTIVAGYPQSVDLVFDDDGEYYLAGPRAPRRLLSVPTSEARVRYEWNPPDLLTQMLPNPSFESGSGSGTGSTLTIWELGPNALRYLIDDYYGSTDYSNTFLNLYMLVATAVAVDAPAAEQEEFAYVFPGGTGIDTAYALDVSLTAHPILRSSPLAVDEEGRVFVKLTENDGGTETNYWLTYFDVNAATTILPGPNRLLQIDPLFSSVKTEGTQGAIILPQGTVLSFHDETDPTATPKTATLTEPAYVGDKSVRADVSLQIDKGDTAKGHYWAESKAPLWFPDVDNFDPMAPYTYRVPMLTPNGETLAGYLSIYLYGPERTAGDSTVAYSLFDEISIGQSEGLAGRTRPVTGVERRAVNADVPGLSYDAGTFRLGDGPPLRDFDQFLTQSHSGLYAGTEPTFQGVNTGWKDSLYAPSANTTGTPLNALHAREIVRALNADPGGLERRRMTLVLRSGTTYSPHQVLKHREGGPGTAAFKLYVWDYLRYDTVRGEVGGEWTELTEGAGEIVGLSGAAPVAGDTYAAATELLSGEAAGLLYAIDLSDDSVSGFADISDIPSDNQGWNPLRVHYDPTDDRWMINGTNSSDNTGRVYSISRIGGIVFIESLTTKREGSCWSEVVGTLLVQKASGNGVVSVDVGIGNGEGVLLYTDPDNSLNYYSMWEDWITGLLYIGCETGEILEIDPSDWSGRREVTNIGEIARGITGEPGGDRLIVCGERGIIREYAKLDGALLATRFTSGQDGVTAAMVWDVAIDLDGTIYFSTFGDKQICRLNTDDTVEVLRTGADTVEGVALDRVPA